MQYEVFLHEEAEKFILSVPLKMQAKIQRCINLLEEFGNDLREPHSKKIVGEKSLFELRIGTDISRLFYFHLKEKKFVITSGFVKKTDKTDKNEILKATKLMIRIKEEDNVQS
jgi:phage-related protein